MAEKTSLPDPTNLEQAAYFQSFSGEDKDEDVIADKPRSAEGSKELTLQERKAKVSEVIDGLLQGELSFREGERTTNSEVRNVFIELINRLKSENKRLSASIPNSTQEMANVPDFTQKHWAAETVRFLNEALLKVPDLKVAAKVDEFRIGDEKDGYNVYSAELIFS